MLESKSRRTGGPRAEKAAGVPETGNLQSEPRVRELTARALFLGLALALLMTAANVYLGLYAGMTVSASIPAAVLGIGLFRLFRNRDVREANIVQTMASAGESLAAGSIFTVPALVLVGAWQDFRFWPTTLIAAGGGLLGVLFMIPLRRTLIVEDKSLRYPEGVACATVLRSGMERGSGGMRRLLLGFAMGAALKALTAGVPLLRGSVEWAARAGQGVFFFGTDISPALLGVGYIAGLRVAALVFLGGCIGWMIALPLMGPGVAGQPPLEAAWALWSEKIRYLGVGAMIVGGLWSLVGIRRGLWQGLAYLRGRLTQAGELAPHERDMPLRPFLVLLAFSLLLIWALYRSLLQGLALSLAATLIMAAAAFLFVAVSSYVVGLVGSSNNPVSGMTISALLATALFMLLLGFRGNEAMMATLGVAAVVCCAACTAGDCSQDLKTGHLLGATPKNQQYAEIVGASLSALIIAPVLSLLHAAYGIGVGLKAPQATLFASLTQGIFGGGALPWDFVGAGMALGVAVILLDSRLARTGVRFRLHLMPMAVGIYLPLTLSVPIFLGGLARAWPLRGKTGSGEKAPGVLLASGLIAGESLAGVGLAGLLYAGMSFSSPLPGHWLMDAASLLVLAAMAWMLWRLGAGEVPTIRGKDPSLPSEEKRAP